MTSTVSVVGSDRGFDRFASRLSRIFDLLEMIPRCGPGSRFGRERKDEPLLRDASEHSRASAVLTKQNLHEIRKLARIRTSRPLGNRHPVR